MGLLLNGGKDLTARVLIPEAKRPTYDMHRLEDVRMLAS